MDRGSGAIHRHSHRHVLHDKLMDRLHAKVREGEHAGRLDGLGYEISRPARGNQSATLTRRRLAIVTSRLTGGGNAKLVERVRTLTTPGRTVDVVVTEMGLAVNPIRPALGEGSEKQLNIDPQAGINMKQI